ncbi:MAG: hypothetical protein HY834_20580 [Devosia nanyangense]|uniref:Uncharacterized protein n=1 Tax=Devosia nanyangense TaxID=1228055 RepID=A0A933NYN1_9HYPH|nr:hypothetical protein [Devosia nanyangense]
MSLRIEGHAILWVTALLSLGFTTFHGNFTSFQEATDRNESQSQQSTQSSLGSAAQTENDRAIVERSLPEIDRQARTLFYIEAVSMEPSPAPLAVVPDAARLILKGIVSSGGELRAVFAIAQSGEGYVTAGAGDVVAGFQITSVSRDRVVASSPNGEATVFELRGTGEGL